MAEVRTATCYQDVIDRLKQMSGVVKGSRKATLSQRDLAYLLEHAEIHDQLKAEVVTLRRENLRYHTLVGKVDMSPGDLMDCANDIHLVTEYDTTLFRTILYLSLYKKLFRDCSEKSRCNQVVKVVKDLAQKSSVYTTIREYASKNKDKHMEQDIERMAKLMQWVKDQSDKPVKRKQTAAPARDESGERQDKLVKTPAPRKSIGDEEFLPETRLGTSHAGRESRQQLPSLVQSKTPHQQQPSGPYQCNLLLLKHPLIKSLDLGKQLESKKGLTNKISLLLDHLHSKGGHEKEPVLVAEQKQVNDLKEAVQQLEEKLLQEKRTLAELSRRMDEKEEECNSLKASQADLSQDITSKNEDIKSLREQISQMEKTTTMNASSHSQHSILKRMPSQHPLHSHKHTAADANNNNRGEGDCEELPLHDDTCLHCMGVGKLRKRRFSHVSFATDVFETDEHSILHSSLCSTTLSSKMHSEDQKVDDEEDLKHEIEDRYLQIRDDRHTVARSHTSLTRGRRCHSATTSGRSAHYEMITDLYPLRIEKRGEPPVTVNRGVSALSFDPHGREKQKTATKRFKDEGVQYELPEINPEEADFRDLIGPSDVHDQYVEPTVMLSSRITVQSRNGKRLFHMIAEQLQTDPGHWERLFTQLMKSTDCVPSEVKEEIKRISDSASDDYRRTFLAIRRWKQAYGRYDLLVLLESLGEIRRNDIVIEVKEYLESCQYKL